MMDTAKILLVQVASCYLLVDHQQLLWFFLLVLLLVRFVTASMRGIVIWTVGIARTTSRTARCYYVVSHHQHIFNEYYYTSCRRTASSTTSTTKRSTSMSSATAGANNVTYAGASWWWYSLKPFLVQWVVNDCRQSSMNGPTSRQQELAKTNTSTCTVVLVATMLQDFVASVNNNMDNKKKIGNILGISPSVDSSSSSYHSDNQQNIQQHHHHHHQITPTIQVLRNYSRLWQCWLGFCFIPTYQCGNSAFVSAFSIIHYNNGVPLPQRTTTTTASSIRRTHSCWKARELTATNPNIAQQQSLHPTTNKGHFHHTLGVDGWSHQGFSKSSSSFLSSSSSSTTALAMMSQRKIHHHSFPQKVHLRSSNNNKDGMDEMNSTTSTMTTITSSRNGSSSTSNSSSETCSTKETSIGTPSEVPEEHHNSQEPRRIRTMDAVSVTGDVPIKIQGWVRTIRKQKTVAFMEINDGSNLAGIQCVVSLVEDDSNMTEYINQITTGCSVETIGPLVPSTGGGGGSSKKQSIEQKVTQLRIIGLCDPTTYPLAKKRHSLEYLRSIAHLRPRTNTLSAVARVRSRMAGAIHNFFQQNGFVYIHTPLITASDCEGAGELFRVTTLNLDEISKLPREPNQKDTKKDKGDEEEATGAKSWSDKVDYKQDFFGKAAYLTVSGQLGGETHACALGDIYTFGPTFRAENSQTARHLAEFHMVEPEMAFCDLTGAMDNAEAMLKFVVAHAVQHCAEDLQFFQSFYDPDLLNRLDRLITQPFARISYREAIGYLQEEIKVNPSNWQYPNVEFGTDLATEHERWLAEVKFQSAVFVYNYPKQIKAFYMRDNDDDQGETVQAMDLLVPGVGELVGGSQREERYDVLIDKIQKVGLNPSDYWWYLDLRKYGTVPHSGYGLGFERLVTYVCGIDNIRDAIAFPRYPGNAEF